MAINPTFTVYLNWDLQQPKTPENIRCVVAAVKLFVSKAIQDLRLYDPAAVYTFEIKASSLDLNKKNQTLPKDLVLESIEYAGSVVMSYLH